MRALVTGAGGFVGGHLLAALRATSDIILHGTLRANADGSTDEKLSLPDVRAHVIDLTQEDAVTRLIAEVKPDRVFHLAGQAFVPYSFEHPWETFEINLHSQLNLLQAIHNQKLDTRILVIGSAEMYGVVRPDQLPITELAPLMPTSPYSVSKVAQDMLALQYHLSYNLYTVRVRPFNHIGPGQSRQFAVSSFASQIAAIEVAGAEPIVRVGDLSAERDLTDVRDIVRAYTMLLEEGEPGGVYNVCSGVAHSMQAILDRLIALSAQPIEVRIDPDRLRPVEIPRLVGDYSRLHARTGWQPQIDLDRTLRDVLADWRTRLAAPQTNHI